MSSRTTSNTFASLTRSVWKGILAAWLILLIAGIYWVVSELFTLLVGNRIEGFVLGFLAMGGFYGAVDWMSRRGIIGSIFSRAG